MSNFDSPGKDSQTPPPGGQSDNLNPNGVAAFETLGQFLEDDGWHPQQIEDKHVYRTSFSGKNGDYPCYAQIMVKIEQFLFYVVAPVNTPEEVRPAIAEFITRANYGMRIGNFEMDFSDGEVRYKSSLDFEGQPLTPSLIRHAVYPAVMTLDHYFPGLMSVMYGGRTPFEAIDAIEGQRSGQG